jgi:hypothetical protein
VTAADLEHPLARADAQLLHDRSQSFAHDWTFPGIRPSSSCLIACFSTLARLRPP